MNYDAKYQVWIIPGQSVSSVLQIFFWTLSRSLWLEPLPLHGWEAAGNASREMLCVSTLLHEKKKKTGTQLLNKLLLSTLFRLHITCVAAGEIVMCGVLSCPTRGTPKLLVAPPLKNNSTFPLIPPALQRNDWVLITPYLLFLIRKCPKGIDLLHNGGLLIYSLICVIISLSDLVWK